MIAWAITDADVAERFAAYAPEDRAALLALRTLILETAAPLLGAKGLVESLKWNQPAYRPLKVGTGTTVRIDTLPAQPGKLALFVHCKTTLLDCFRGLYPGQFGFQGNRALVIDGRTPLERAGLADCIGRALTYHQRPVA